jgi:hypothetical protein
MKRTLWRRDPNRGYKWKKVGEVVTPQNELKEGPPNFTPDELNHTTDLKPPKENEVEYNDLGEVVIHGERE